MPLLEKINLRCAGQMKDQTFEYMMDRDLPIKYLQLDASNLISDSCWRQYFQSRGSRLECIKLSNLDSSMDDESVRKMASYCTNLRFLKLEECWNLADDSLLAIATFPRLEHLSLEFLKETTATNIIRMVQRLGSNLRTLSLRGFKNADDQVLETIHQCCRKLSKLRFANNAICTDQGFKQLFRNWDNPPLTFVDLSGTRDVDNRNPDGPQNAIGLASEGFKALMEHSGAKIEKVDISSCRHISRDAFSAVFDGTRKFPSLRELDISFHTVVDGCLLGRIFQCCPALTKVIAFACFSVRDVQVPASIALIGGLHA
jgi:DNA repair protein RAD7